ncbi:MAG: biotin/lipoyl-binding protein [Cyclobacteriaceae bacterium]|jgi:biotin carboxyl carrier protein|nr:biotin/lipoyl-binding protein [Flammeovirgaceae bacterium]MCZ8021914.1 biotin/lipoyl-binding protein [Cytophagales bacterium]MCZ8329363.1 biotin/lipoyl-binding protein [Cyclobacteriaceae bacterium]
MQAHINNTIIRLEEKEGQWFLNDALFNADVAELKPGHYHIVNNKKSYHAEVVKYDVATKTCTIKVNNTLIPVQLKNRFDLLLDKMGMANVGASKVNNIKAPMPGLIINLKIQEGDSVKTGDPLLILEAMKMENILKSPGDGVVKKIKVKKGDSVEKNQILIEF